MNILLATQNDNYYLPGNINYLINNLPNGVYIKSSIVLDVSPFGKKLNFFQKALSVKNIFGIKFFIRHAIKYIYRFIFSADVKNILKTNKVKILNIRGNINNQFNLNQISNESPDLIISVACNQIFKKELIAIPKYGIINLHTSLLPRNRGLMPSFWALKNSETYTGVSVFFVDEGIDSGEIIIQEKIEIKSRNLEELVTITKAIGMKLIIKSIELIKSNSVNPLTNDESNMSYNGFPTKEDVSEFLSNGNKLY